MLITTKQAIKDFIGNVGSGDDVLLTALAVAISNRFAKELRREVEIKERIQYFDVDLNQTVFHLDAYPVTACAVYNDESREFLNPVPSDTYTYLGNLGELVIDDYSLTCGAKVLKVVYTGGMASNQADFADKYPDLEMAARIQAAFMFEKRKRLGVVSESIAQTTTHFSKVELLPDVKDTIRLYARKKYV